MSKHYEVSLREIIHGYVRVHADNKEDAKNKALGSAVQDGEFHGNVDYEICDGCGVHELKKNGDFL